ncbi:MAG: DJ-1/PfpI family protein [Candidatus Woesearchaeota archaeon]
MKKILIIIAQNGFQEHEYENTKINIEKNNIKVITASPENGIAIGKYKTQIKPDISIKQANQEEYDAIIIIGGPGATLLINNNELLILLKQFQDNNKLIAAICIAPTILAKSGILLGKKATVWNEDNMQSAILEQQGGIYVKEHIVIDGNIITADGPDAAVDFGKAISNYLKK